MHEIEVPEILDKNLVIIFEFLVTILEDFTKTLKIIQDSYQESQGFLHWEAVLAGFKKP